MKRNIIFFSILTVMTLSIMASGFFYTQSFKSELDGILKKCTQTDFFAGIDKAEEIIFDKKNIHTLLYPKDIIEKITISVKQAKTLYFEGERAGALAQVEKARTLIKGLY